MKQFFDKNRGETRSNHVRNELIGQQLMIESTQDKIAEGQVNWFRGVCVK